MVELGGMPAVQLDLADLLSRGADQLARDAPGLTATPAVASRLARVLGARLPCLAVIHWVCPVCRTRSVTRWRCGPRCARCGTSAPMGASLLRQLPPLPVRHWVLSLPAPHRHALVDDPRGESAVIHAFVRAIFAAQRAGDVDRSLGCGAIVAVHRSGSALDLNFHLHALVVDGVFHRSPGGTRFTARSPGDPQVADVARAVHRTLAEIAGPDAADPAISALRQAARARRTRRRAASAEQALPRAAHENAGVRVFVGDTISADDRASLRRLCEYVTRHASARLAAATGTTDDLQLPLPPQPDGATHAPLSARDAVARLVAATPSGPAVSLRTFGVLAPRAARIWQIHRAHQLELPGLPRGERARPPRVRAPRCVRCEVDLEARAVEDASDP